MSHDDQEQVAPTMSNEEAAEYRVYLQKELDTLIIAQGKFYSKYKERRIILLQNRLGIVTA